MPVYGKISKVIGITDTQAVPAIVIEAAAMVVIVDELIANTDDLVDGCFVFHRNIDLIKYVIACEIDLAHRLSMLESKVKRGLIADDIGSVQ